jgi:hypothetical protein
MKRKALKGAGGSRATRQVVAIKHVAKAIKDQAVATVTTRSRDSSGAVGSRGAGGGSTRMGSVGT